MLTINGRKKLRENLDEYLTNLDKLYVAIQRTTGCNVIIDSSKFSSYGFILSMLPSVDVYYLHLIRDSRAVAYSRLKRKKWEETGIYMARYNPLRSSLQWSVLNLTSELLNDPFWGRYMQLRYEELIQQPEPSVRKIVEFLDETPKELSSIQGNKVKIKKTHTNWGNPIRNIDGYIELMVDREWQFALSRKSRALVSTLTMPLLLRYRYY